jgi:hypothetical protein
MAFYLDLTNGSDSNNGLTESTPKLTTTAAVALFDAASAQTLYVKGIGRNQWFTLSGLSNKTITTWPGASTPILTHRLVAGSWNDLGGNVYSNLIPDSLTLSAVTYGFGSARSATTGGYYGFLRRYATTGDLTAAASGGKGKYHYNSVTGEIRIYVGGANPNVTGLEVGYSTVETTPAAFQLVGCTNCTISGFNVGPLPKYSGQYGWGVRCEGTTGCTFSDMTLDSTGSHAIGTLGGSGNSSNNTFNNIRCFGGAYASTPLIANGNNSEGALVGIRFNGCSVYLSRFWGIDDLVLDGRSDTVAAMDAISQIAIYGHADTGTPIADVEFRSGTVDCSAEPGPFMWQLDNSPAVATVNRAAASAFPLRIVDTDIINFGVQPLSQGTGHWSATRCRFRTTRTATPGFGSAGIMYIAAANSNDYLYLCEACTFISSLDNAGGETRMFNGQQSTGGTKRLYFKNCTFYNTGVLTGQFCGFFDCATESVKYFEAIGCIFAHKSTGAAYCLYMRDSATALAGNPILDCVYYNIDNANSRYAQIATVNAATWFSTYDTAGSVANNVLSANPFVSDSNLRVRPASALYGDKRATTAIVPIAGIDGTYQGYFGAYQNQGDTGSRSRGQSDPSRMAFRNR